MWREIDRQRGESETARKGFKEIKSPAHKHLMALLVLFFISHFFSISIL